MVGFRKEGERVNQCVKTAGANDTPKRYLRSEKAYKTKNAKNVDPATFFSRSPDMYTGVCFLNESGLQKNTILQKCII